MLERLYVGSRWALPVHAIEARLSHPLPFAMGCGAQSVERYNAGRLRSNRPSSGNRGAYFFGAEFARANVT
jgi:hypothetical protein